MGEIPFFFLLLFLILLDSDRREVRADTVWLWLRMPWLPLLRIHR